MMSNILEQVKIALGETSRYNDERINLYIKEVQQYMLDAGVAADIVQSPLSFGVISIGVNDLLYGGGALSNYFYRRVIQLTYKR